MKEMIQQEYQCSGRFERCQSRKSMRIYENVHDADNRHENNSHHLDYNKIRNHPNYRLIMDGYACDDFSEPELNFTNRLSNSFQQHQNRTSTSNNIIHQILHEQDLSGAGVLFSLDSELILHEFPYTIQLIKTIVDTKSYTQNLNQQSIVEIVLTKCIQALKETRLIQNYYEDLLDLLDICLKYSLSGAGTLLLAKNTNSSSVRNSKRLSAASDILNCTSSCSSGSSTPHANIVSDILSCILLDYLDPELSEKAIPICVKLLQHPQCKPDLIKQVCSYLNLVACRSSDLLADYVYYILNAIIKCQYSGLTHLLYQICESQPECIYPLVKHLIKALKLLTNSSDLIYIFQIIYLVSLNHVHFSRLCDLILKIVIVHLDELVCYLECDECCQEILLDIFYSISNQVPIALDSYIFLLENPRLNDSYKVDKIIGTVGKSLRKMSEYCTNLLIQRIKLAQTKFGSPSSSAKLIKYSSSFRKENESFTVHDQSAIDHVILSRKTSIKRQPSACSTSKTQSTRLADEQKRYIQLLNEIYEIAQIFPNVLDLYYRKLGALFPQPSENIAYLLKKIRQSKSENSSLVLSRDGQNCDNGDEYDDELDLAIGSSLESNASSSSENNEMQSHLLNNAENKILEMISKFDNELKIIENQDEKCSSSWHARTSKHLKIIEENDDEKTSDKLEDVRELKFEEESGDISGAYLLTSDAKQADNRITHDLFMNELKNRMEQTSHPISSTIRITNVECSKQSSSDDVIEKFCTKHMPKIRSYIQTLKKTLPMPIIDTAYIYDNNSLNKTLIKQSSKGSAMCKSKKKINLKFACFNPLLTDKCLFSQTYFEMLSQNAPTWIHVIFLAIQAQNSSPLNQWHAELIELRCAYEHLNEKLPFNALLTSSFPSEKQINELKKEINEFRVMDLFEFKNIEANKETFGDEHLEPKNDGEWLCYLCANPQKAARFLDESNKSKPIIQGQFKEKHGKWKLFKKWQTRTFTLTGDSIVYFKKDMRQESLNVRYIRNIQTMKKTSKSKRNVLQAFEIITEKNSFVLKPKNSKEAEEWLKFLQLSKFLELNREISSQICNQNTSQEENDSNFQLKTSL